MFALLRHAVTDALRDRKGVTAAEYAVLAVGIVLVVATAAALLGNGISGTFSKVISALGG